MANRYRCMMRRICDGDIAAADSRTASYSQLEARQDKAGIEGEKS